MQFLFIYALVCLIVGVAGINRKLGFWGYFFGSFVFTPLVGLLLVLCSDRRKELK